jgi:hypothetical protein
MQSPNSNYSELPADFKSVLDMVKKFYLNFVPRPIRERKNIEQAIQPDTVIIATVIWGIIQGHPTQIATYRDVTERLFPKGFPSRSRYTRTCANLAFAIKLIRYHFVKSLCHQPPLSAIDSMPLPLCKPVRNTRARLFGGTACLGYNASKDIYFYGLKFHATVSPDGFLMAYSVTAANIHDANLIDELLEQAPTRVSVGDKGYLSRKIQARLAGEKQIHLIAVPRKNMRLKLKKMEFSLMRHRKKVETVFSSLSRLGVQNMLSRSLRGFESRLESILLAYSILLDNAHKIEADTLKYSLGYFSGNHGNNGN